MALQRIAAQIGLPGLILGRAHDDRLAGMLDGLAEQFQPGRFLEVLDDVPQENQIVGCKLFQHFQGVTGVNLVIQIAVHFGQVIRVAFDPVNLHLPVVALVPGRVALGFLDVGVFAEEVTPFAKADADIKD